MAIKQITKDEADLLNVLLGQVSLKENQNGKPIEVLTLSYVRAKPGMTGVELVFVEDSTSSAETPASTTK
ncbi:hypothetical protein [Acinetobacter nosocomialis]|uniref:hypothetical protein n=1 Tax=Acinetobacter nosocomialis TaxID=106654 RepID=UPI0033BC2273